MKENLSIVIPVYNEEKRIGRTLLELKKFCSKNHFNPEIILVDDGSKDHTPVLLKRFEGFAKVITLDQNHGKGFAVKTGMLAATKDTVLFMDADLATPLKEIKKVIKVEKSWDILIGVRDPKKQRVNRKPFREFAAKVFMLLVRLIVPIKFTDTQCGFKAFTRPAARIIFNQTIVHRWGFDVEVLYLAKKIGYQVKEMPVEWEEKGDSKVRLMRDAINMVRDLIKIRLNNFAHNYELVEGSSLSNERNKDEYLGQSAQTEEL